MMDKIKELLKHRLSARQAVYTVLLILIGLTFLWTSWSDNSSGSSNAPAELANENADGGAAEDSSVNPIRGAKLAAADKNPCDPFQLTHPDRSSAKACESAMAVNLEKSVSSKKSSSGNGVANNNGNNVLKGNGSAGRKNSSAEACVPPRLVGILNNGDSYGAIIAINNRQELIMLGETVQGISLLYGDSNYVVVDTVYGQQQLKLEKG